MDRELFIEEVGAQAKRPYETPQVQRVELALDETLGAGCKLGSESVCVGPPITAYNGGS